MKTVKLSIALPLQATNKKWKYCFNKPDPAAVDDSGGGLTDEKKGQLELQITAEQKSNIEAGTKKAMEYIKKNGVRNTSIAKTAETDSTDYKRELESLLADPYIKTLHDYKKTGKNIDELFKSVAPASVEDVSKVSRKDLFSRMLADNQFNADEITAENKRFDSLSPLQQEHEVKGYRDSIKSKTTPSSLDDIFKSAREYAANELPKKEASKKIINDYISVLQKEVPSLRDIEGKEYPKELQDRILNTAKRVSISESLTPEGAKKAIAIAKQVECPQEDYLAGCAFGAEIALREFYAPNADVSASSRATAGKGKDNNEHIHAIGSEKPKRKFGQQIG